MKMDSQNIIRFQLTNIILLHRIEASSKMGQGIENQKDEYPVVITDFQDVLGSKAIMSFEAKTKSSLDAFQPDCDVSVRQSSSTPEHSGTQQMVTCKRRIPVPIEPVLRDKNWSKTLKRLTV